MKENCPRFEVPEEDCTLTHYYEEGKLAYDTLTDKGVWRIGYVESISDNPRYEIVISEDGLVYWTHKDNLE